jgi:hypothetical protein
MGSKCKPLNSQCIVRGVCLRSEIGSMKNAAAVELGLLGGRKGGLARAARMNPQQRQDSARKASAARMKTMTPQQRSAVARKAADARWGKKSGG